MIPASYGAAHVFADVHQRAAATIAAAVQPAPPLDSNMTVLLVEDDHPTRCIIEALLKSCGHQGEVAFVYARALPTDVFHAFSRMHSY